MKFTTLVASLAIALLPSSSVAVTLSYDPTYDQTGGSLSTTACSDGEHGLATRFPTFGSLPKFPHIGAAAAVEGWNSANCGTCWELTYTNGQGVQSSINVLAIDHTDSGFNIALAAMNELTGGQAVALGRVDVASQQVDASICGL